MRMSNPNTGNINPNVGSSSRSVGRAVGAPDDEDGNGMNNANRNAIDSGEFIVDDVIREGSATRYNLALDRVTALETAIRRQMKRIHKTYHEGILNRHVKNWEECGMSSCRMMRSVLDERWWEAEE